MTSGQEQGQRLEVREGRRTLLTLDELACEALFLVRRRAGIAPRVRLTYGADGAEVHVVDHHHADHWAAREPIVLEADREWAYMTIDEASEAMWPALVAQVARL